MLESDDHELPISRQWLESAAALLEEFERGHPFPLLVLDNFLDPELASGLLEEFPDIEAMPRSRDYVFADKRELSSVETSGPAGARFHRAMTSPAFSEFLAAATGEQLFVDPMFHGGGFHQGGDGSFLDMHVDFNIHPLQPTWLRRRNILIYLNPEWDDAWGGHLLVRSQVDEEPVAIAPRFNRAVIMVTDERSYHGYRKMALPPTVARRSLATYAYREVPRGSVPARTTRWVPEEAGLTKRLLARNYNHLVRLKNRFIRSGTASNR